MGECQSLDMLRPMGTRRNDLDVHSILFLATAGELFYGSRGRLGPEDRPNLPPLEGRKFFEELPIASYTAAELVTTKDRTRGIACGAVRQIRPRKGCLLLHRSLCIRSLTGTVRGRYFVQTDRGQVVLHGDPCAFVPIGSRTAARHTSLTRTFGLAEITS